MGLAPTGKRVTLTSIEQAVVAQLRGWPSARGTGPG